MCTGDLHRLRKTARFFPHKRPGSASLVTKFKQSGLCICGDYGSPYYSPRLPAGAKSGWRRDRNASTEPRRCSSRAGNRETVQAWEQLDLLPVDPSWGTVSRTCEAVCFKKNKTKNKEKRLNLLCMMIRWTAVSSNKRSSISGRILNRPYWPSSANRIIDPTCY